MLKGKKFDAFALSLMEVTQTISMKVYGSRWRTT